MSAIFAELFESCCFSRVIYSLFKICFRA